VDQPEQQLPGGNLGGAVRVGDTVRRAVGPWTSAVHALLKHLERSGFTEAPRVLGVDERGREILTFIEGATAEPQPWPAWSRSEDALLQIGELLRRFHDAVLSFRPPDSAVWRFTNRELTPGEIVCHNDVGPYNVVWRRGRIVGLIDWDVSGPGSPLDDLAFTAWQWVPLHHPSILDPGWEGPPDVTRRLSLLCDAYGLAWEARSAFVDVIPGRMQASLQRMSTAADAGEPAFVQVRDRGYLDGMRRSVAYVESILPSLRSQLVRGIDRRDRST
jgi:Phosphotransferase enzyme family